MEKFDNKKIEDMQAERTLNDAELIKGGAKYVVDSEGSEPRLEITAEQYEQIHQEMEKILGEDFLTRDGLEKGLVEVKVEKAQNEEDGVGMIEYEFEVESESRYVIEPGVANRSKLKIYGFDETVWWIYPDMETQKQQNDLIKTFQELKKLQEQCYPNTGLHSHFENQMKMTIENLTKISSKLETNVLLGRPFFDNFEFIQFFHKDRNKEERCFFNYKVAQNKAVEIVPILQTTIINQTKGI